VTHSGKEVSGVFSPSVALAAAGIFFSLEIWHWRDQYGM